MKSILIALPRKPPCKADDSTRAPRTPLWTRRSREFEVRVMMVKMVECFSIEICGLSKCLSGCCCCCCCWSTSSRVFRSSVFMRCFCPCFRRFSGWKSISISFCSRQEVGCEGSNSEGCQYLRLFHASDDPRLVDRYYPVGNREGVGEPC
jgi:hypothetical protein